MCQSLFETQGIQQQMKQIPFPYGASIPLEEIGKINN